MTNLNFTTHIPDNQQNTTQNQTFNQAKNNYHLNKSFKKTQGQRPPLPLPLNEMYKRLVNIG
jgi:hypothetical protein